MILYRNKVLFYILVPDLPCSYLAPGKANAFIQIYIAHHFKLSYK